MKLGCVLVFFLFLFFPISSAPGQQTSSTASVRGTVIDPSGALVVNADVTLEPQSSSFAPPSPTRTSDSGRFAFPQLPTGEYILRVLAKGFAAFESKPVALLEGRTHVLTVQLAIQTAEVHLDVPGDPITDTDPNHNADAVILRGRALDDLSPDPDVLRQELQALSAGDSPSIYVDGFSDATFPPKESIREIRINQNPYSARNDTDPLNGVIEVFTKPGSDKLHASFLVLGNDSVFNAQSPFTRSQPPYYNTQYEGSLSNSLNKKTSYFVSYFRRVTAANAVIDAVTLDSNLNQSQYTQALPSPGTNTTLSVRFDYQWGERSTVSSRYSRLANRQAKGGIGELNLPDQAYDATLITQTAQLSNSQIVSNKIVNDTRFEYTRTRSQQTPQSTAPTLTVQGAFTSGGSNAGSAHDNLDRYELQNYVAIQAGTHYLSPGVRLRVSRDANVSRSNFNGQYIFATLGAYQVAARALAQCQQSSVSARCSVPGATQFSITRGTPSAVIDVADLAVFFQDDWKLRPRLTLSYGLRYEAQNHVSDTGDFAPRVAFSWAFGGANKKPAKFILRVGSGIFYTRLGTPTLLQAERQNGVSQQNFIVANPGFYPNLPDPSTLGSQSIPTVFHISPAFRSPYIWNNTVGVDHPLGARGTVSLNYIYNRGVHLGLTRNINSPLPGTYDSADPTTGIRPFGTLQNIDQYESIGLARTNRLFANVNFRGKHDLFITSNYMLRFRSNDVSGSFPSNEYNVRADYGRAPSNTQSFLFDVNYLIPLGRINISALLYLTSGVPFNIVVGQDLNGDSQFNDRPAFATDFSRPTVIRTAYGTFDTNPLPTQTVIPVNYGTGPSSIDNNLQIYRYFTFGPALPQPYIAAGTPPRGKPYISRRYNLLLAVEAQNPLNHVNAAPPVGVLGSPLFGRSTALVGGASTNYNRRLNLLLEFRF